jgi:cell division protein FtsB
MLKIRRFLIAILLVFLFSSLTKNILDYSRTIDLYQNFKSDYDKVNHRNRELKTDVLQYNDPNRVEKTIRNQLNMLKDGEVSILVPSPTPAPYFAKPTPAPVYSQWIRLFVYGHGA